MIMSKKKREKILNYSIISLKLFWIWETKYEHYESDVDLTVTEQEMLDTMMFRIYRTQKGFNHVKVINNDINIHYFQSPLDSDNVIIIYVQGGIVVDVKGDIERLVLRTKRLRAFSSFKECAISA